MENIEISKLPGRFLKDGAKILSKSISEIYSLSISHGIFPNTCKVAKLKPIFKKDKKVDPSNYRPISLLLLISKTTKILMTKSFWHNKPWNLVKETWSYRFLGWMYTMVSVISLGTNILYTNREPTLWLRRDIVRCASRFYFRTIVVPCLCQWYASGCKIKSVFICRWFMSHVPKWKCRRNWKKTKQGFWKCV